MLKELMPQAWQQAMPDEFEKEYCRQLESFLTDEYANHTIYPPKEEIFNALTLVKPSAVKVVIIGQDPYILEGQAHGLSFSVKEGVKFPKSLNNIFVELCDDVGCQMPTSGSLIPWAQQGVLLLNSTLTVRANASNSHAKKGWSQMTARIIKETLKTPTPKVFILWGKNAEEVFNSIYNNEPNVFVLKSVHPSPLSAYRGFFGSKPFSKANDLLVSAGANPIDWGLP